jgi:Uma2 family endonuclease
MLSALHPPKTVYQVWKNLPEGTICQIINDSLVMSPSPLDIHQVIVQEIFLEISIHLRKNRLGYLRLAPYDVHLSKSNILQPDICFIKENNKTKLDEKGLMGAPDLVIEVLSPSTKKYDLFEKKEIYKNYGVTEYFVIDPATKLVKNFILKNNEY